MRPLAISETAKQILLLQQEIQRSQESRYDHRLHAVLLVAHGVTCPDVSHMLGDAPRTVEYWVHRFQEKGLDGLMEGEHPGRPSRLTAEQLAGVNRALRRNPAEQAMGVNLWDGKTLSAWIAKEYGVHLGTRQCQRLFRQLNFRLRKPRPVVAGASKTQKQTFKKNSAK
ncbi:MAG: transposase [Acidobacteria bacterium]|nr:transposase [Acidobacteriota bacterium]